MRLNVRLAPAVDLRALADAVSTPGDPQFGRHLSRAALDAKISQAPAVREALTAWLAGAGVAVQAGDSAGLMWAAEIGRNHATWLLGHEMTGRLIARRRLAGAELAASGRLPPELAGAIEAITAGPWGAVAPVRVLEDRGAAAPPLPQTGFLPADLARGYGFTDSEDGEGETIAVMALGGVPEAGDLFGFARACGRQAPSIELVPLTPLGACASDPRFRFETTMELQWLAAFAPRARIVVYLIDPAIAADPWGDFLEAVLADMSREITVAVTSWSAPARQYYAVHGRSRFAGLLDRAAVRGITVAAASGDWGAYDGFPAGGPVHGVCDPLAPGDTFPGCEARVLSVGGTQVLEREDWREIAWSAPVSPALRADTGLPAFAGCGGVSTFVPLPDYQRSGMPAVLERGEGAPARAVDGRVQPDVALVAWGPGVTAYACVLDEKFRDDAGGTSVAAPIWAAIVARINQRRRRAGLGRLGQVQPRLYAACAAQPGLLRDVVEGVTDLELPTRGEDGSRVWRRLPGFKAMRGFDAATGLGVPDLPRLAAALAVD